MADHAITVRAASQADARRCGQVLFDGFSRLADRHGFERDFPSADAAASFLEGLFRTPTVTGLTGWVPRTMGLVGR